MKSLTRIKGVFIQEYYITLRSLEVLADLPYYGIVTIVVFGFVFTYLSSSSGPTAAKYILMGMIFWEVIRIAQYSISVGSLWNIWSRNMSNMFITPLTITEYFSAHLATSLVKAIVIVAIESFIAYFIFGFNILEIGYLNLFLFFINLMLFAWTTGIWILGLIFRFGTRIQSFAWSAIMLFQPLTAALFPVSALPPFLQSIAWLIPTTYVFESGRAAFTDPTVDWYSFFISLSMNLAYFILSVWFFDYMFKKSKETGQFARNEG